MRGKTKVLGLALAVAVAVGCAKQCFLTECDYNHYRDLALPPNLECDPSASVVPATSAMGAPPTVLDPDRHPRYLSLAEAIAMGLENGTVGDQSLTGRTLTSLVSLPYPQRFLFPPESNIRVLALEPAIVGADIEGSMAKFDVHWTSNVNWSTTDEPTGSSILQSFQNGTHATVSSALLKPLPTGGVAGVTFTTTYTDLTSPPSAATGTITNPSYRPALQFQFEQPLLQAFGVEINQIRPTHPGSILTPFNVGGRVEGVLITRLRFDQQRLEFERQVHVMLVNIEAAYWNLYGAYWTLYSREQGMRQAYEAWKINRERFDAGRVAVQDVAQSRQQYEQFRAQRLQALGAVLDDERSLRALIGLPMEDGTRLIPLDKPTLTPYQPDWNTALNEALALRPELLLARQDVKFRQLDLINQKNLLLPDLRFTSTYNINSLGTHLDGGPSDPNNAFANLARDEFNDWSFGLRLDMQLGFRDAHSAVRSARLNLARSYAVLQDQESKAVQALALEYTGLIQNYEIIRADRAQREAAAIQLGARFKEFLAGRGTLDFLLEAQRIWSQALADEYTAIVAYNVSLVRLEFAKGTILTHDNVVISEGALPHCAQVRAVEHERERSKALVLLERADPVAYTPCGCANGTPPNMPQLPSGATPSLPALFEGATAAPALPDRLPQEPAGPQPLPRPPQPERLPTPRREDQTDANIGRPPQAPTLPATAGEAPHGPAGVTLSTPAAATTGDAPTTTPITTWTKSTAAPAHELPDAPTDKAPRGPDRPGPAIPVLPEASPPDGK
jgi:outer membrane protein TolC